MTQASVISVNPAKSTLGDLNPDINAGLLRRRVLERESRGVSFKKVVNGAFALGGTKVRNRSVKLMLVRSIGGAVLLLSGIAAGFGGSFPTAELMQSGAFHASIAAVMMIVGGISLCLGLLSRITMSGIALVSTVLLAVGLSRGVWLADDAMLAVSGLAFAMVGPGFHSLDATLRRNLFAACRRRAERRAERRLSYEAFRYQNF